MNCFRACKLFFKYKTCFFKHLSISFTGEILRHVTQYISNCPTALGSTLPFDETSILTKITHHLDSSAGKSVPSNLCPAGSQFGATGSDSANSAGETSSVVNNSALFLKFHEQLKAAVSKTFQKEEKIVYLFKYFIAS